MQRQIAVVVFMVGGFACSVDRKTQVDVDASTHDGASVDGALADAPDVDAPVDATPSVDAPTDASIDAPDAMPLCLAPMTMCGTQCVDLMTSNEHCGACGWNVVGNRSCVGGQPLPAWDEIPATGGPTQPYRLAFWTGRRFMVAVDRSTVYAYDPHLRTWSSAPPLPFDVVSTNHARIVVPERETTFVWTSYDVAGGREAYLFVDGTTPQWTAATTSGAPSARREVALAQSGSRIYVMFGEANGVGPDGGATYDLNSNTWTAVPNDTTTPCDRRDNPVAVVGGVLMSQGGLGDNAACGAVSYLDNGVWSASSAYPSRLWQRVLSVNNRLVVLGGYSGNEATQAFGTTMVATNTGAVVEGVLPSGHAALAAYAVRMGHSVLHFSGVSRYYNAGGALSTGAIGEVTASGINWYAVTSTGMPEGRAFVGGDSYSRANQQETWTGRVAIIFGGSKPVGANQYPSTWVNNGATFQPPAACVCPADAPECANVTNVTGACN